jgi:predicted dehydrogenase
MKIAYVGCGYVFDIYMRTSWAHDELDVRGIFDIDRERALTVGRHYGLRVYPDYEALLADPEVDIVVNLTNIGSHYEVTRRALMAGKHVYSEKPITTDLAHTQALFAMAAERKLVLGSAPCNLFSDTVTTMWKAIQDGAIGKPLLVYAELDDNPAHLMRLETVRSPTGAPWPYVEEFQSGCTFEHVAYHLVWICAMFGPALSVSAFSQALVARKTAAVLDPPDTPDFSVGCLSFANGVAARVTCSIVAPRDHRLRIIGEEGEISADSYRHFQSPVRLERFSPVSLAARKFYTLRAQPAFGRMFGIGGGRVPLIRHWKSHAVESDGDDSSSLGARLAGNLRRRQIYAQDKILGIAEMARALREGSPPPLRADFLTHVNELTLLIQQGGRGSHTHPVTSFEPIQPPVPMAAAARDYRRSVRSRFLERILKPAATALRI